MKIRYVRDWLNGSDKDIRNYWSRIQVLDKSGNNIAIGKDITASAEVFGDLAFLPNGTNIESDYGDMMFINIDPDDPNINFSPWLVETKDGKRCLKNNKIGNSEKTSITIPLNFKGNVSGSCEASVDSESGCDFFGIYVNDTNKYKDSGNKAFTTVNLGELTQGEHNLRLEYYKDGSSDRGTDSGYVANISFYGSDGSVTEPRLDHILVDLGKVYDTDKIITNHKVYNSVAYNHKLEVSEDGIKWVVLFDSEKNGAYIETSEGKTYNLKDMVKFSFYKGFYGEMPSPIQIEQAAYTNLPYRIGSLNHNTQLKFDLSQFGGMPYIKHEKLNWRGKIASTNLPLRFCSPKTKYFWQIKPDILNGYPSMMAFDENFNPDDIIAHLSDDHYVTPLRAKILINKYLSEFMQTRGKRKSPLVKNISMTEKRQRLVLDWESPVDDPFWRNTLIIKSETGFASVDGETNEIIYPSDWNGETLYESREHHIEKPMEITGLTNGKKYYFTFITISKDGTRNCYLDSRVVGVPKSSYRPLYGSFGEYIGREEIIND